MIEKPQPFQADEEKHSEENVSHIPVHQIYGFSKVDGYVKTDEAFLREELTKLGLYGKDFGYRAIHPRKISKVLETGTDRDDDLTDVCQLYHRETNKPEVDTIDNGPMTLLELVEEQRKKSMKGACIVYDIHQLGPGKAVTEESDFVKEIPLLTFKEPNNKRAAVLAIIIFEDFGKPFSPNEAI